MVKEDIMQTERKSRRILVAAILVLALGFLAGGADQAAAKVVVRAKVGPVTVKVGSGHSCCTTTYVRRSHRRCGNHARTVVVSRPRPVRREAVWMPGHFKVNRCGYRKWVPGHWRLV